MSAFIIANVDVTDPEGFAAYRDMVAPTVAAASGRYRVRGGATEILEGSFVPRRLVILEFESMQAARDWYHSDAYAPALALRKRSAVSDVTLVEGID